MKAVSEFILDLWLLLSETWTSEKGKKIKTKLTVTEQQKSEALKLPNIRLNFLQLHITITSGDSK